MSYARYALGMASRLYQRRLGYRLLWAGLAVPPLRDLPATLKRQLVRRARNSIRWTPRRLCILALRVAVPQTASIAIMFALPRRTFTASANVAFTCVGLLLSCVGLLLAMQYEMSLLIPAIRAELGGICTGCGYDLRGNLSGLCPECGCKVAVPPRLDPSSANRIDGRNFDGVGIAIFSSASLVGLALFVFGTGQTEGAGLLIAIMSLGGAILCLADLGKGQNEDE